MLEQKKNLKKKKKKIKKLMISKLIKIQQSVPEHKGWEHQKSVRETSLVDILGFYGPFFLETKQKSVERKGSREQNRIKKLYIDWSYFGQQATLHLDPSAVGI